MTFFATGVILCTRWQIFFLTVVYNDEQTFIQQSTTYLPRNVAGQSGSTQIEYWVPACKSMYTTGKEFSDTWLTSFNTNYPVYYDVIIQTSPSTKSGSIDLTKYNQIVSNYFIDPTTRVWFQGRYCYDCLLPKFPGYAVSTAPDTDTTIIKGSRGKLRLIEYTAAAYGFSYVTNLKSQIQFSSSLTSVTLTHAAQGNTRQSWGNFYVQNNGVSLHDIYALHDIGGTLKFEKIYSTTDSIKAHLGFDRAIWWPTKNFFMVRQYDKITWDGYGLNSLSVQVSKAPSTYLPNQQFEPFSTGPIKIDGDLPFDAVFANDMMFLYRENTKDGNKYVTIYSWTPGHFRVEYETQVTNANTATSFVSFGTDNGALLWWNTQKTGILYKPDGTTATISVSITDSTKSTLWSSTASPDFRLIQTRSSPLNSNESPTVYAYFEKNVLFYSYNRRDGPWN